MIERYHGAIKIEHLWRQLPDDGQEMSEMVEAFRRLYNEIRPHEMLEGERPRDRYLTPPDATLPTRQTDAVQQPVDLPA